MRIPKIHAAGEQIAEVERGLKVYAPACGAPSGWATRIAKRWLHVNCKRCLRTR